MKPIILEQINMKKLLIFTLFAALLLPLAGSRFNPYPVQKRFFHSGKKDAILLLRKGQVNFELVAGPTKVARFAAEEAAAVLSKLCGTKIKVLSKPTGSKSAIIIGCPASARAAGIHIDKLDRDGFRIKTHGKNIIIIGRDDPRRSPLQGGGALQPEAGSLNGTYAFLERFADVRFFFPGEFGTVVPVKKDLVLPEIDISDRPDWLQRRILQGGSAAVMPKEFPSNIRKRLALMLRLETFQIPNCHGLAYLDLVQRFGKTHPEYFALDAGGKRINDPAAPRESSSRGQICFSSGIKEVILKDAEAFLKKQPSTSRGIRTWSHSRYPRLPFFNIMPNDSCYRCRCAGCWEHFSKGPQATSNYIWKFFTDIANEGQKRNLPGNFTTMAYESYTLVPECDIPSNLLVMLAMRGPWNEKASALVKKDIALLKQWNKKLNARPWVWTYPSKYAIDLPGVPNYAPKAMGAFYARIAPHVFGAFAQADSDRYFCGLLNFYVFSRVAWDNKTDVQKLLDDYHEKMFGPGAPFMKKVSALLEEKWLICAGEFIDTPAGPKTKQVPHKTLWEKIYDEKTLKTLATLFQQAEKAASQTPGALKRLRFVKKELFVPLIDARKKWINTVQSAKNWSAFMPENSWSKKYFLPPCGKAKAEVKTSVQMKHDKENFYFRFECEEPFTSEMYCSKRTADDKTLWQDSCVEVHLVPDGKETSHYQFIITASGAMADIRHSNSYADYSWNSGIKPVVKVTPGKGYTVSLTLPRKLFPKVVPGKFRANFNRHRAVAHKKTTRFYSWSIFANSFVDREKFGFIHLKLQPGKETLRETDMQKEIRRGRFLGSAWVSAKPFFKDHTTFVSNGFSIHLKEQQLLQFLPNLQPDTDYILSCWVKLDKNSSFNIRLDEANGRVHMLPKVPLPGPSGWLRQEFRFKTGKSITKKPYIRFQFNKGSGNLNAPSLIALPKKKR